MDKNGVMEIRKLYKKKEDCSISRIAYGYLIAGWKLEHTGQSRFLTLDKELQYRYLSLIEKGMAGKVSKNIVTYPLPDKDPKKMLQSMIHDNLQNQAVLDQFYKHVSDLYPYRTNIVIILIANTYDVPNRSKDGRKDIEDAEDVYEYVQGFICPVVLEKPGIIYDSEKSDLCKKEIRKCVEMPIMSFIYPSFEDRTADNEKITVFMQKQNPDNEQFVRELFDLDDQMGYLEQQEIMQGIMEHALDGINDNKISAVAEFQREILKRSSDNPAVTKEVIKESLDACGLDQNVTEKVPWTDEQSDKPEALLKEAVVKTNIEIKCPDFLVRVKADKADKIKETELDGSRYLLIDISGNEDVTINGIQI